MKLVDQEAIQVFGGAELLLRQALVVRNTDLAGSQAIQARGEHITQELDGIVGALGEFGHVEQHRL